jgi:beta-galactosidase
VGVLYNWDSDAIWAADSIRNRDHFRHYPMQARVGISRALINGNIPWEHVTPEDLRRGLGPRYKAIYLPAQLALDEKVLGILTGYVQQGGRVVLDAPGGWYDEHGLVFNTGAGSVFERLFGTKITDFQYSNNVPRSIEGQRLDGFILELNPTTAKTLATFQNGAAAVTENRLGKGSAVVLAFDASFACFKPGNTRMEQRVRRYTLGAITPPYACEGAVVYRLGAPDADHYFFINDDEAKAVALDTRRYKYVSISDPVSGESLRLGAKIDLEAYSGRWLRFAKK